MLASNNCHILWITILLYLSLLIQWVLLAETTCAHSCKSVLPSRRLSYHHFSLNCNTSSAEVTLDTQRNRRYFKFEEIYLECHYQSRNSTCNSIYENLWNRNWVDATYHKTFSLNSSLPQDCQIVGCFHYHGYYKYPLVITPSTCNITGVTIEFEMNADRIPEGGNKSICVRRYGQKDIPVHVKITATNFTNSSLSSQNYSVDKDILFFSSSTDNRQCIQLQVFEDDKLQNGEEGIVLDLEILNKTETTILGSNRTLTLTITDNDVEVTLEHLQYTVHEGDGRAEICIKVLGNKKFEINFTTNGLERIHEGLDDTKFIQFEELQSLGKKFRRHCISINITDDAYIENKEEFEVTISSSDSFVSIDPENATATVFIIDNDEEQKNASEGETVAACITLTGQLKQSIEFSILTGSILTGSILTESNSAEERLDNHSNNSSMIFSLNNESLKNCVNLSVSDDYNFKETKQFQLVLQVKVQTKH